MAQMIASTEAGKQQQFATPRCRPTSGEDQMSESDRIGDEHFVNTAAIVSLALGTVLLIAPATARRVLGVDSDRRVLRTIGAVDLAVAPGLYFGHAKWPWLVARAASNPLIAAIAVANARTLRARVIAAGLIGATLLDVRTAARLRASVSDDAGSVPPHGPTSSQSAGPSRDHTAR
jgi:hypothetical protein